MFRTHSAPAYAAAPYAAHAVRGGVRRSTRLVAALVLAAAFVPSLSFGAAQTSLAMHGAVKQADAFTHFSYVKPDAPKGGALKLGVVGSFDSLNPFIVRGTVPQSPAFGLFASAAVYESLMARSWDEPFSLYGLLAQSVDVPEDRSSITFHLNPLARWSDGRPVTADDVLFSFTMLRDQGRPNHRTYYKKVEKAKKLDSLSVKFSFKREASGAWDREMPLIMGLMPVLPAQDWVDRPFNQTTLRPPVASGPYRITKVEVGRSVTLTRNPAYWGRDLPAQKGLYNFDEVRIDFYRDDSVALQAFKAGAFDLRREPDPKKWAKAYDHPAVADGRIVMERIPHHRTEALSGFVLNTRRPLLRDAVLREALDLAFDFDWINRTLFQGLYKRSTSFFPNSELAANAGDENHAAPQREKLLKAAELLKQAGYVMRGERLHAPSGAVVAFDVMLSDPAEEKVALEWARGLGRLGIEARVRTVDSAQYQARLNGFDYDVTTGRWFNSLSPGNEQMFFWSCAAAKQNGSRNYAGVCDPSIDALAAAIPAARTRQALVAATRALDRALLAGHYVVPFYYLGADHLAYWNSRLDHSAITPLYGPILESWWHP